SRSPPDAFPLKGQPIVGDQQLPRVIIRPVLPIDLGSAVILDAIPRSLVASGLTRALEAFGNIIDRHLKRGAIFLVRLEFGLEAQPIETDVLAGVDLVKGTSREAGEQGDCDYRVAHHLTPPPRQRRALPVC